MIVDVSLSSSVLNIPVLYVISSNASGIDCHSSDVYLVIFMCIDMKVC